MLPLKSIRATFDYVYIYMVASVRFFPPFWPCFHYVRDLFPKEEKKSEREEQIAKYKKWHLLGIRIHFPFQ